MPETNETDLASGSDEAQRARRERILALKRELVGGDLLTAAEVAEILDIHPRTVGEYIHDGKLQAFQFGGGWKISEAALRAFVRGQSQSPTDTIQPNGPTIGTDKPSPPPSGKFSRRPQYKCSFCGKSNDEVRRLIAGPGGIYICDACIQLCNDIIAKETATATSTRAE